MTISGGMTASGAGMAPLGISHPGMLQVAMVSGIGPRTPASSVDASGAESAVPEGKTEANASADTASAGRPGILKQEGGRSQSDPSSVPAASDASAAAADDNFAVPLTPKQEAT